MFTEPRFHQKDESTDSVLKSNLSLYLCQQHTVRTIQSKRDGEKHHAESLSAASRKRAPTLHEW
jgi:hypothetical protein